jgi:hypothetical protein
MAALLLLVSGGAGMGTCAFAPEAGSYVVSNTTYYVNPDTGAADDGGDTSTGEGMCRNSTYPQSLYVFKDGKHYITLRIKLISFIKNVRFKVQGVKGDSGSYKDAGYTVTGENKDENTKDFLLEVPAADVLINPSFFVGPMNRDVTYFVGLNLDSAKKDGGSFAAFNKAAADVPPAAEPRTPAKTSGNEGAGIPADSAQTASAPQAEKNSNEAEEEKAKETNQGTAANGDTGAGTSGSGAAGGVMPAGGRGDGGQKATDGDRPAAGTMEEPPAEEAGDISGITEYSADGKAVGEEAGVKGSRMSVWVVAAVLCIVAGGSFVWLKRRKP